MAQISGSRRVALWSSALAHVAGRMAGRHPYLRAAAAGAQAVAGSLGRALGQLWLQITGFLFFGFAVIGALAAHREYEAYASEKTGAGRLVAALCFSLAFAWFGLTSFRRARRK